jgi:DNA-binding transcriptional LysR family regulator/DNA-binding winged helix-turn-helix (wHTH) protein
MMTVGSAKQLEHSLLWFDRFALDLTRGCLREGEEDVPLPPKPFQVLCHLAANAGRLVSKQELDQAIWPDVTVSDASLVQCIRELRHRLGDDNHQLIKTVSRRGYCLNAVLTTVAPHLPSRAAADPLAVGLRRPNLNLTQLRTFIGMAECGSFTATAKQLHLTQAVVFKHIHELEQRFKVSLIDATGTDARLTKAGEELVEHARHLLDEDDRTNVAMQRFVEGWLGRVRIGTSMTILMYHLPPILRQLKTDHPQLDMEIRAGLTATTLEMLKSKTLDLGLCSMPIADPAFQVTPLFADELVAILPSNIGRVPKKVRPRFLSQQPLILGNPNSALRRAIMDWLAASGPAPKPVMEFHNVEAMKRLVDVGLGTSIVPRSSVESDRLLPNTVVVPLSPRITRQNALVQLQGKSNSLSVKIVAAAMMTLRRAM